MSGGGPSRSGSVTSLIKRVFSKGKDLSNEPKLTPVEAAVATWQGSTRTLNRNVAEDVIPELDENQTTIMSMKAAAERKPTTQEIFGPDAHSSEPVDAPTESSFSAGRFNVSGPSSEYAQSATADDKVAFTLGGDQSSPEEDKGMETVLPNQISYADDGSDGDSSESQLLHHKESEEKDKE